ncbi:DUF2158 domain-containing protein [Stenotrophomonas maltophilia]|uniref:YodC family protein n=1 Tax=Stenotrophomonas TaxID=40323 RepID=UPI001313D73A|nr:DUF2158 domain-containing protein [Stenotrophomonas maltophilia]MBA0411639.1 DUF2158 domain-containing protein [Stenotrophomonas maltophilia]MBA0497065.1 DUF2158 domain-containing protein [Stenotrophomonas maltophilia]MBA0501857.1 DUF2158 domain-containing protein [Stenotrophomonas maltophilia]MBA0505486.1 DUF2158 domain-containing protein [Stenotrophomonas maltophilia]
MDFKAGDVVKLKSGSLRMTIAWVEDGEAWCEWFDTKHEPQGRRYAVVLLIHDN